MKVWIVLYVEPVPDKREIYHVCTSYGRACYMQEQEARQMWNDDVILLTEDEDGDPLRRWVDARSRHVLAGGGRVYKANGFEIEEHEALTD